MKRSWLILILGMLAGCVHAPPEEATQGAVAEHGEPGTARIAWPDGGGECVGIGDRVCCTPAGIYLLGGRDGG